MKLERGAIVFWTKREGVLTDFEGARLWVADGVIFKILLSMVVRDFAVCVHLWRLCA